MKFAKYFGYNLVFLINQILAYYGPNDDLILANSGDPIEEISNKVKKRILENVKNHDNMFGKDPELEKNTKKMVHYLDLYKVQKKPIAKEWVAIKNTAADAVKGDCDSAEILFEQGVIPRSEYEILLRRCGLQSHEKKLKDQVLSSRVKERRFPDPPEKNTENDYNNEIIQVKQWKPEKSDCKSSFITKDLYLTPQEVKKMVDDDEVIVDPYSSSKALRKSMDKDKAYPSGTYRSRDSEIKHAALALLRKNIKAPMIGKLAGAATRPVIEAIKRIDKSLEDYVNNNVKDAPERHREMNEEKVETCKEKCLLETDLMTRILKPETQNLPENKPYKSNFYPEENLMTKDRRNPANRSTLTSSKNPRNTENEKSPKSILRAQEATLKKNLAKAILPEIINGMKEAVAREASKPVFNKKKDFMVAEKPNVEGGAPYQAKKTVMKAEKNPDGKYKGIKVSELKREDATVQSNFQGRNEDKHITEKNPTCTEKEKACLYEEELIKRAELKEIREAKELAAENVKKLGGSNAEAEKEANRTELVKRMQIEKENVGNDAGEKPKESLSERKALLEAENGEGVHSTLKSIGENVRTFKANNDSKSDYDKQAEEELGIVDIIADNTTRIAINGSVIELPLNGVPNAKAKTAEEEKIKRNLSALRDRLRNKITKRKINTGLVTLQGLEGILNLPESCNTIHIKNGVVFFDQAGYESMLSQKIDTKPLFPVYSKGSEPLYYKAKIKEMDMKIPSGINGVPQKVLLNDFETINVMFAKKIEVANGEVICESWDNFSARMRPKVYQEINKGVDEVPESARKEFERVEHMNDLMQTTSVKLAKNMEGSPIVEMKTNYGHASALRVPDAINKAIMIVKGNVVREVEDRRLNVAEQKVHSDYTNKFIESVENGISGNKRFPAGIKEAPLIRTSEITGKSLIINQSSVMKYKRQGNDPETQAFNYIILHYKEISMQLGIGESAFVELLSRIEHKTVSQLLKHFLETASNFDIQRKLMELDIKDFMQTLRGWFGSKSALKMALEFFKAFSTVLNCQNSKVLNYNLRCYNEKLQEYLFGNRLGAGQQLKIIPNMSIQSSIPVNSSPLLSPLLQTANFKQKPLAAPLCNQNQVASCILQGTPLYFQQRNQPQWPFQKPIKQ
ncbi:hypothetical protein GINT2_000322 [Glugoides intestinalis]